MSWFGLGKLALLLSLSVQQLMEIAVDQDQVQSNSTSNTNFWICAIGLGLVGYFLQPPYSYLIFLGAIFSVCWEISDRLRQQYNVHKANQQLLKNISENVERGGDRNVQE